LYVRKENVYDRVTPVTQNELAARLRFATVAAAIKTRKANMMKDVQDQEKDYFISVPRALKALPLRSRIS
jgi:hypothetical protein